MLQYRVTKLVTMPFNTYHRRQLNYDTSQYTLFLFFFKLLALLFLQVDVVINPNDLKVDTFRASG